MGGGMMLKVVGQERADRHPAHPLRKNFAELPRGKGGGDALRRLRIDGHGLKLRVNSPGEIPPDDGILPLKVLEREIASLTEPAARVLAEVEAAQLLGT